MRKFSLRLEPAASEVKGKCANHLATEAPYGGNDDDGGNDGDGHGGNDDDGGNDGHGGKA